MNAPRKRIKELEVMVADAIQETPDTSTLLLFTGNDRLEYQAGHFLTIDAHQFDALERFISYFEEVKGKKEPPRAYSLSSAPHERFLAITVKEERFTSGLTKYPPLLSPLLVKRTTRGMRLVITGFTGPYVLPPDVDKRAEHLLHICAGSGIVPNYSILKQSLQEHSKLRHTLVYSNKTWDDVIFARELFDLQRRHQDRLRIVHTLTRESPEKLKGPYGEARAGRISAALLREVVEDPAACIAFACGPGITPHDKTEARKKGVQPTPRFLETALAALRDIGFTEDQLEYESYG
ncbi:MAG: oxidoreductase [Gemmatimonadetes bacterium 13_1_40CM_66_11]|nr:MAG: oxidoreductase [Gemmatimonadetes bacterium 13_1_40CM_66_11]